MNKTKGNDMYTMRYTSRLAAIVLALALVLGSSSVSAGQVQEFEPDFYESLLTGFQIEASGPIYEITDVELQHYFTGEGEVVRLSSDTALANLEISFFDDTDSAQESLEIYMRGMENVADDVEVLDRGITGDIYYAVAVIEYQGLEILYYVQVEANVDGNIDMLQSILTTTTTLQMDLEDAQAEVTIDQEPFMGNIDPATLADVVSGNGSLGDTAEANPAEAETFIFNESQLVVSIGPDFAFHDIPEERPDVEAIRFLGPDSLSMVAVGQTGSTPEAVLTSFSSGVEANYPNAEVMDEQIDNDYAWRLLSIPGELESSTFMLIVVDTTVVPGYEVLHAHEVSANSVAGSLTLIQDQVSVDGQPLMPEIDPEEIAAIAGQQDPVGQATETPETPVATEAIEEEENGRTENPRDGARLPEVGDDEEEGGNTSETGGQVDDPLEPTEVPVSDDADVPGELTDSSWEGEVHGHLIEWDAAFWFVDTEFENDLVSDEEMQEDVIVLQTESGNEIAFLNISLYGEDQSTPEGYLNFWTSDQYLDTFTDMGAEAEVVEARTRGGSTAVLMRITDGDGSTYLVVRQAVRLESGELLLVTLDAPDAELAQLYERAQEVTINGDPVLRVFSPSQIQRIVGE